MIGSLRGALAERLGDGEVVVDVGGVGYRVLTVPGAVGGGTGDPLQIHVHTHVREDAIVLYGFATSEERACFEALIGAHGVGPALALAILAVHPPRHLADVVESEDVDALVRVPGVGRKTAARLLIDLKSGMDVAAVPAGERAEGNGSSAHRGAHSDVRAALDGLGYSPEEVRQAVRGLPEEGEAPDLLRSALRELAGNR